MTAPTGDVSSGAEPTAPVPGSRWHGEVSVYGVMVGMLLVPAFSVGLAVGNLPAALPVPLLGMALLLRPGRVRQFGVGLLASALVLPTVLLSFVLVQALDSAVG